MGYDKNEFDRKAKLDQEQAMKHKLQSEKTVQEDEGRKRSAIAMPIPGRPEPRVLSPTEDSKVAQADLIRYKNFIDAQKDLTDEQKKKFKEDCYYDPEKKALVFNSVAAAAKFSEMKPEARFSGNCKNRDDAVQMIREFKQHGILNKLDKISYDGNELTGKRLEDLKQSLYPSPSPYR